MKIAKSRLKEIIKEEYDKLQEMQGYSRSSGGEHAYPEGGSQEEAQYEVMRQLGLFLATLLNQGHKELADELDQILTQAQDAGLTGRKGW